MELVMDMVVFLLGLCAGSFVNMLVYRKEVEYGLKRGRVGRQVIKNNRSCCDYCGRQLKWWENVPVISWLALKGKSRCCDRPLPYQYPAIEIVTGLLFLLNFQFSIFNFQLILNLVIVTLLVFSAVFDAKHMILPDFSTYILIVVVLGMWGVEHWGDWSYLVAGAGSWLFLLALNLGTKGKGMGMGDVKLAMFMGIFLGWQRVIVAFYVAFVLGAAVGVGMMVAKKIKGQGKIAFGPYLILGTMISWFWGEKILSLVYRYF